ncbi:hypothetical protein [Morganella morganii]|uniref:hypothetical protein n=1 Tax=Morganella morganii TaxID=582 RepID=UPI001CEF936D|nr:hypothetical protein [Morganella morganii]
MKLKYLPPLLLSLVSAPLFAAPDIVSECSKPGRSVDWEMQIVMEHMLHIDMKQIDESKTRTEILSAQPAGELLISQLAQETYDSLTDKSKSSPESYKKLFSVNPPYNLVLRITYVNKDNKKNIFIASGLADKDECSVHFNGWLTEQREF